MKESIELTFGELVQDALRRDGKAPTVHSDHLTVNPVGAHLRLPTRALLALDAGAVGGSEVARSFDWPVASTDALFDAVNTVVVAEPKGSLPVGDLPQASTLAASANLSADADPSTTSLDYHANRVAESRSSYSLQSLLQSPSISDFVESAQRAALRREIVRAVLVGSGVAPQPQGLSTLAGVTESTYPSSGPTAAALTGLEQDVVDADGDELALVWAAGQTLHSQLLNAQITPSDYRKIVERRRITLSGAALYRSPDLPAAMGLTFDPRNVAVILQGTVLVTLDRVSRPGTVRVTSRLHFDLQTLRPSQIGRLTQA